jgi:hypothetical protein
MTPRETCASGAMTHAAQGDRIAYRAAWLKRSLPAEAQSLQTIAPCRARSSQRPGGAPVGHGRGKVSAPQRARAALRH